MRLRTVLRRRQLDKDLQAELAFHVEMKEEKLRREGDSDAESRARRLFGNRTRFYEQCREVWTFVSIERGLSQLRYAIRSLSKNPSFTLTVILTLALGIGSNSAVFSAINAVLLRPLPFPQADQLMMLDQFNPQAKTPPGPVAPLRLEDWNKMNSSFQSITGYYTEDVSETSGVLPEKLTRAWVAPRFFQVWAIAPAQGRLFTDDEQRSGGPRAAIVSHNYWERTLGSDPQATNRQVRIGSTSIPIVGVMPSSFLFLDRKVDVWTPTSVDSPAAQSREATWFNTIGRLKPRATVEQARADLSTVQAQLGEQYPKTDAALAVRIRPLKEVTVADAGRSLWLLFASVTLLLLIACTNIAGLMVARTADREQEMSVRFSLGASRASVMMQLLTEAFVLALAGSIVGLLVATGTSGYLRALAQGLPRIEEVRLDWTLVGYSMICAVGATLLFGLFPALRGTRQGIATSLARTGRGQVSARRSLQWLLVGIQVSLSVTLLVGAGLLLRSFQLLGRASPGFDPSHVLTFRVSGNWAETMDMARLRRRMDGILDSLQALPGVEAAATALALPGVDFPSFRDVRIIEVQTDPNQKLTASTRHVSSGYFETMRIPLLSGEACSTDAKPMVLVNRIFAEMYLAGRMPLGYHIEVSANRFTEAAEIRGVVANAREQGLSQEAVPTVYRCDSAPNPSPAFLVRTSQEPLSMAEVIRRKIHEIEPERSVYEVLPLVDHLDMTLSENRLRTILLTFFALTAVSLTCVGLYGTLSYFVKMRRREVGLRIALGAFRREILWQFLLKGLTVSALGCVVGLCLAVGLGQSLAGMLYGVSPLDPATFIGVLVLVLITGALSSILPAVRAACVDPMKVLREE